MTLRVVATVAVLTALYFLLPFDRRADTVTVLTIAAGCAVLVAVMALQLRAIARSRHPGLRGVEALAFTIPLYLLLFALAYFVMVRSDPASFSEGLTRTDALYFAVTVLTTVGFGDISARSEAARLVVTLQMLLDLILLGLVVRLFLSAIKRGQQRNAAPPAAGQRT